MDNMKQETVALNQKMLLNKMSESDGKLFLILYIEYLEKFTTYKSYSSIEELLWRRQFDRHEIESMMKVLYKGSFLDENIKNKILQQFTANKKD